VSRSTNGPGPWSSGRAYEAYVGRWSALVAPAFIQFLDVGPGRRWLDVGCGTGILTRAILDEAAPEAVVGIDPSEPFLALARSSVVDRRVVFAPGDAASTGQPDHEFGAVVSGLVLNQVPDIGAALLEARRTVVPDGVVGAYVWDYARGMAFIRAFWDAAIAVDADAARLDQARRFPIAAPAPLRAALAAAGLRSVVVDAIDVPTAFASFDDLWTPFTLGTGDAPAYLESLDAARRDAVRDRLRADVPIDEDGGIRLTARAWAVRGRSPG
jgi:SAM-dependent methyltransferase